MIASVVFVLLACHATAQAWEVEYNANSGLLPSAAFPEWYLETYNGITPTVSSGELRIQNSTDDGYSYYSREHYAIAAGVPVTMEARMRVAMASLRAPRLSIQTLGAYVVVMVRPDCILAYQQVGSGQVTYSGDFTTPHTIRLAYDGARHAYAWVDGVPAFSLELSGSSGQSGVNFGSIYRDGSFDSYWQYVAYSKEFLPVPEPAGLLALGVGGLGILGAALRRRSRARA